VPNYRRAHVPGGTFFLTLVAEGRAPRFDDPAARGWLHQAMAAVRRERPFEILGIVLLPDPLHLLIELPRGDADFSTRMASMKARFTRAYLAAGGVERRRSESRVRHRNRGVWQRRFYEHRIRDEDDLHRHLDYIHYNPVKHGVATCPHAWLHSSFQRWVERGGYELTW
jgi:putative transposase